MRILLIIASLFILAGCETYSVGGTRQVDNVRLSIGVHSGYYPRYGYSYPYYYRPPVIVHRHIHPRPVIVNRHIRRPHRQHGWNGNNHRNHERHRHH